MKRLIIATLFLMFFLSGCEAKLNTSLYISSIGFEYQEERIVFYFLCNPLNDIIRSDDSETKMEYFTVEAQNIADGFAKVEEAIPFEINFMHLQTVIFHESFLVNDKLPLFLQFMRDARIVTYNFYCFLAKVSVKDIFEYESPDTISFQHSLLSSPSSAKYHDYGCDKMPFLSLANNYYDSNRYLHIPVIDVRDTLNEKSVLTISGFGSVTTKIEYYELDEFKAMNYLYSQDFVYYACGNKTFELRNYRFFYNIIDDVFAFTIRVNPLDATVKEKNTLKADIEANFRYYFDQYIEENGDLYVISQYNYENKTSYDTQKYRIIILI